MIPCPVWLSAFRFVRFPCLIDRGKRTDKRTAMRTKAGLSAFYFARKSFICNMIRFRFSFLSAADSIADSKMVENGKKRRKSFIDNVVRNDFEFCGFPNNESGQSGSCCQ